MCETTISIIEVWHKFDLTRKWKLQISVGML